MSYGDGGFYFLRPVGSGYGGIEVRTNRRSRSFGSFGADRPALGDERLGTEALTKIATYWAKKRVPYFVSEVDRINKNSKGHCGGRKKYEDASLLTPAWKAGLYLAYDEDMCNDTRYANYKKALSDYSYAVAAVTTLTQWVASGKAHKYKELPSIVRNDAEAVSWIKTNIIDPRYAATDSFMQGSGDADPCYISVTINDRLKKLGYPDSVICDLAAKYKSGVSGANEVKNIVNNNIPYERAGGSGKGKKFVGTLPTIAPMLGGRGGGAAPGAYVSPLAPTPETAVLPMISPSDVPGSPPEVTEYKVGATPMGPQVQPTPADVAVAQAAAETAQTAAATVDAATGRAMVSGGGAGGGTGIMGFLSTTQGKLVLGAAALGLGYYLWKKK